MLGSIGSAFKSIGNAAGGLLSTVTGDRAYQRGADQAAKMTEYNPWAIRMPFGETQVHDGVIDFNMNEAIMNMQNQLRGDSRGLLSSGVDMMGQGQQLAGRAASMDPNQIARQQYNMMSQLAAPGEHQARTGMENRLFSQGLLGSSGGAAQMGQMQQALGQADLQRQQQAMGMGQQVQAQQMQNALGMIGAGQGMFGQGLQGIGTHSIYDNMAMNQIMQSANMGAQQSAAHGIGAQAAMQAASNRGDMIGGVFGGVMNGLSQSVGGLFGGLF